MPYTLGKVFVWYLLAGLLGLALGWMLHHLLKCSQKGHGASTDVGADARAELDRLRARNANLEQVVGERDNLQRQLVDLRGVATSATASSLRLVSFAPPPLLPWPRLLACHSTTTMRWLPNVMPRCRHSRPWPLNATLLSRRTTAWSPSVMPP